MPHLGNNHKIYWHSPYLLLIIAACAGSILMYCSWSLLSHIKLWGIRLFFDANKL